MKKIIALILMVVLVAGLAAVPAGAEIVGGTARTTLGNAYSSRVDNIRTAAWMLNGTVLGYGETFSFNDFVGERTAANGYVKAVNGRGVQVTGGGVAQVATTIYLALLGHGANSGIVIDDVSFYGDRFTGTYVDSGELAVLVDYDEDIDFAFTNYAASELYIELWLTETYLYCSITTSDSTQPNWNNSWNGRWNSPVGSGGWQSVMSYSEQIYCGSEENLLSNVTLAADTIYDTTLRSGDTFSFNSIIGPREERYGYVGATNGRGVKVIGGGVAQVASVVWLAVKNIDSVSIVEKSTYGERYNQDYVESSADAILVDYNAGTDFAFRYTGTGSLTIYTYVSGNTLYCDIYEDA